MNRLFRLVFFIILFGASTSVSAKETRCEFDRWGSGSADVETVISWVGTGFILDNGKKNITQFSSKGRRSLQISEIKKSAKFTTHPSPKSLFLSPLVGFCEYVHTNVGSSFWAVAEARTTLFPAA